VTIYSPDMLSDATISLAQGPNFAVLTTLMPDGVPQSHVMWVDADDSHILVNTEIHRRKYKNVLANPLATVAIIDRDNPFSFVEVRGRVVEKVGGQEARDHIDKLSLKYLGRVYGNQIQSERVILRIAPDREFGFPA
jgi:PPOX class probable F420-dependent enzyme